MCNIKIYVMVVLHGKQGVACDKKGFWHCKRGNDRKKGEITSCLSIFYINIKQNIYASAYTN